MSTPFRCAMDAEKEPSFASTAERRRVESHEADVVIVGAGVVGCALASAMGKQGRSVLLLERSLKEPNRIVGELLQPGGVEALKRLGLEHALEGIDATTVKGYSVIYHGESVSIPYPTRPDDGKRYEGRAFHHGRFIMKLREAARKAPNVTVVETTATDLVKGQIGGEVLGVTALTDRRKDYFFGSLTVIADGYASKFRKQYRAQAPVVKSKFFALELIDADLPAPGFGHVILDDCPPILIYQIGSHETRILMDIPDQLPSASVAAGGVKAHLQNAVQPALPPCVRPSFAAALERGGSGDGGGGGLRSMPNSWLPPATNRAPGIIFVGDALNMRHPLTGGGMTVAFNDVILLTDLLSPANVPSLGNSQAVLRQMAKFHWARKGSSTVINILANALYALFAADSMFFSLFASLSPLSPFGKPFIPPFLLPLLNLNYQN